MLITCENLMLSYENNVVLSELTFTVNEGDCLCIVGENGSGKSTLVKALLGLKRPGGGRIIFGDGLKSSQIGYLPQQTGVQKDFPANVGEVVLSGRLNSRGLRPFYTAADRAIAAEKMKLLGISELKRRCYRELSGGQQQRVLLARALCATKKLLLLDEPVAGLDPVVTAELYSLIRQINESGITVIMVSHDIVRAVGVASHILHLRHTPLFFGSVSDYAASQTGRAFLNTDTEAAKL